jgi:hypothetical protein
MLLITTHSENSVGVTPTTRRKTCADALERAREEEEG